MNKWILKFQLFLFRTLLGGRVTIYEMLAETLKNGISLADSIRKIMIAKQKFSETWHPSTVALNVCYKRLTDGRHSAMFSLAMRDFISDDEFMVLFAAEENGRLDDGLADVVSMMDAKKRIASTIRSSLATPSLMVLLGVIMLWIVDSDVMPHFEKMLPYESWNDLAKIMKTFSSFIIGYGVFIVVFFIAMFAGMSYIAPRLDDNRIRPILDKLPFFAEYKNIQGNSALISISTMLSGGTSFSDSLKTVFKYSPPYLKKFIAKSIRIQSQGGSGSNGDCLNVGLFNNKTSALIFIYADLSDFDKAVKTIAYNSTEELIKDISSKMAMIGLVITAAVVMISPIIMIMVQGFITKMQSLV